MRLQIIAGIIPSVLVLGALGCSRVQTQISQPSPEKAKLVLVAESDRQWTGVAVSKSGRTFVNFPRWSDSTPISVGELSADGIVTPYPTRGWNDWVSRFSPERRFVCVQSVTIDDQDRLWALDAGNPSFAGIVPGAPKLIQIDLETNKVVRIYPFPTEVAPPQSYLNDVRFDTQRNVAYLTDSGLGALVVLDLKSGHARRLLADHSSTKSEGVTLTIGGRAWIRPDGSAPQVHADGIALSPDGETLYFQALTGRTLYRIPTEALRDSSLSDQQVAGRVEAVGITGAADGLQMDGKGDLYISALEKNAITRWTSDGKLETVISDPMIAWPDSFALNADGSLLFTTARIHEGANPSGKYGLWKLELLDE